jgi:hypothetical protein
MPTLDYAPAPRAAKLTRPYVPFVLAGLAPTALLLCAFFHWIDTGDPVESLAAYKAYHYIAAAVITSLLSWFAWACWRAPRRWRGLFCLVALLWVCLNSYWARVFVREVRADDPSGYYQSLWDGQ